MSTVESTHGSAGENAEHGAGQGVDPSKVASARERLDAHVREIMAWHFDPETGTPFWLGD